MKMHILSFEYISVNYWSFDGRCHALLSCLFLVVELGSCVEYPFSLIRSTRSAHVLPFFTILLSTYFHTPLWRARCLRHNVNTPDKFLHMGPEKRRFYFFVVMEQACFLLITQTVLGDLHNDTDSRWLSVPWNGETREHVSNVRRKKWWRKYILVDGNNYMI